MTKTKTTKTELTDAQIRCAFQATAEAVGGDILQCCRDCEEEEVITRDGLYDYLYMHGGKDGDAVSLWLMGFPGSIEDLEAELNRRRVPKTWD